MPRAKRSRSAILRHAQSRCRDHPALTASDQISEFQKFRLHPDAYQLYMLAIPSHREGRFAIVTDVGGGMRWTLMVLLTRAPDADGEDVWS
jgi:hypothetical protein